MGRNGDVGKGVADNHVVSSGICFQRDARVLVHDLYNGVFEPEIVFGDARDRGIDFRDGDLAEAPVGPGAGHGIGSAADMERTEVPPCHAHARQSVEHRRVIGEHNTRRGAGADPMREVVDDHKSDGVCRVA